MAIKKTPSGIQVSDSLMFVKSTKTKDVGVFAKYFRFPGLGSFTLPAEAAATNETTLIDGSIASAGTKGVGNITGSIGARNVGIAHQFVEDAATSGESILVAIAHPAESIGSVGLGAGAAIAVAADGKSKVTVPAVGRPFIRDSVLEDYVCATGGGDADAVTADEDNNADAYVKYSTKAVGYSARQWMSVFDIEEDGSEFYIAPGITPARAPVGTNKVMPAFFRNPGLRWSNVLCTVSQFDSGDFQSGSVVSSSITLQPRNVMPAAALELRTDLDAADFDA